MTDETSSNPRDVIATCTAEMDVLELKLKELRVSLLRKNMTEEKKLAAYHASQVYKDWIALTLKKEQAIKRCEALREACVSDYSSSSPRFLREAEPRGDSTPSGSDELKKVS